MTVPVAMIPGIKDGSIPSEITTITPAQQLYSWRDKDDKVWTIIPPEGTPTP